MISKNELPHPSVLVIDDDSSIRLTIKAILDNVGYKVFEAGDGISGLMQYQELHHDIVLVDAMMPGIDGFQTCSKLKLDGIDGNVPVIMLTSLDDNESVNKAFESGATDYLTKPLIPPLLIQRIQAAIQHKQLHHIFDESEARNNELQRIAKLGYWSYDLDTQGFTFSHEIADIFYLPVNELRMFKDILQLVHAEDRERLCKEIRNAVTSKGKYCVKHRIRNIKNREYIVEQTGEVVLDECGTAIRMIGTIQDITERETKPKQNCLVNYHDQMTDLPNRRLLEVALPKMMRHSKKQHKLLSILLLRLDRLDRINDSFGYAGGDLLLTILADRIRDFQSEDCFIARLGTKTFILLHQNMNSVLDTEKLVDDIYSCATQPCRINNIEIIPSINIGITLYPFDTKHPEKLVQEANTALHIGKKTGNPNCFFRSEMRTQSLDHLKMEKEIHDGINNNEFVAFYQPQIEIATGKMVGMEALVRWRHPEKGLISPIDFIPIAEETGLIVPIGAQVMLDACSQTKEWNYNNDIPKRISVNLSAKQLIEDEIITLVEQVLHMTGLPPNLLEVEITESLAMQNLQKSISILNCFRDMGVKIAMDDFGTGYSSLSVLQQLPLDTLKVDQAFIKNIGPNGENGVLAKTIITMAKNLGLHVIAEGVETQGHLQFLKDLYVDEMQGYLYSPPLPAGELEEHINRLPH